MNMKLTSVYFILCICAAQATLRQLLGKRPRTRSDSADDITIEYTIENQLTNSGRFKYTMVVETVSQAFYEIMREAAVQNTLYRFKSKMTSAHGRYITAVNGLEEDTAKEQFWAVLLETSKNNFCLTPVGVGTLVPKDGQHVKLSFETYDIFNKLPECEYVGGRYGEIEITYTIKNSLTGRNFDYTLELETKSHPFINVMQEAAAQNSAFGYKSTLFTGLGEFINSINDLDDDVSRQRFWAFLLQTGEEQYCTLPVGVSSFTPKHGDHIVFSYATWSIFDKVVQCGSNSTVPHT